MIDIYQDHVIIFNQKVIRPTSVSVTQWYDYWEAIQLLLLRKKL